MTYRVIQWSTGHVGVCSLHGIIQHPDLELVGLWVHSDAKVGRDAGELCGLPPTGVLATNDADALLALDADVVSYTATADLRPWQAVKDICRILESGKNVVSSSLVQLLHPSKADPAMVDQLEQACKAGGVSMFTSGIDPGFANDLLPIVLSGFCERVDHVRVQEILNYATYDQPEVLFDTMGFGKPLDDTPVLLFPGALSYAWGGVIHMLADALDVEVTEIRERHEKASLDHDVDIDLGIIEANTMAGLRFEVVGVVGGEERLVVEHVTRVHDDVAPGLAEGSRAGLLPHRADRITVHQRGPRARRRGRRPQHRRRAVDCDADPQRDPRRRRRAPRNAVDARPTGHPGSASDAAVTMASNSSGDIDAGRRPGRREVAGDTLHRRVDRRGDAVQPAEQRDLPVEVVGLDRTGAAGEALPRRSAAAAPSADVAELEQVAAPAAVLVTTHELDPGRLVARERLAERQAGDLAASSHGTARGLDGIAEVHQQLLVLPSHDVRARLGLERRSRECCRDLVRRPIDATRVPAEVEQTADRRRVRLDHPRLEMARRAHHTHGVDVGKGSQRHPLVGHAVLRAHDRGLGWRARDERVDRGGGVLTLHRQQHDVLAREIEFGRMTDRGDRQGPRAFSRVDAQTPCANCFEMRAPRDQRDVVVVLEQPGADHAADRAGLRTRRIAWRPSLAHPGPVLS